MTRNSKVVALSVILVLTAVLTAGCGKGPPTVEPASLKSFAALPAAPAVLADNPMAAKIELGRMLYYDARLSKGQTVSCNSCHRLSEYGVDGQPTSEGHAGQRGTRNSPTVYNAALQFVQFWDGRAPDVEKQAGGPMLNPVEMAMPSEMAVVAVLKSMPGYLAAFRKAFPGDKDPVTFAHAVEAIGGFERGLITPSRWDRFLQGDQAALTAEEKSGFNHFLAAGCDTCHSGVLLGGNAFQKLGVAKDYSDTTDTGRYQVTRNESDRMFFKVPTLRNVAMTGPYFHNGKIATLADAVDQMAEFQTGRQLAAADRDAIVTFLKCLTGDLDGNYVRQPDLPKSTSRTPRATAAAGSGEARSGIPGA
ncbi:MAG: cytochrome c peroxidase [Candidatus Sulfopaludibacter sp.]|nr:cytochrome c peroxidase [Candidatus Sulfopaludibacter sp.]